MFGFETAIGWMVFLGRLSLQRVGRCPVEPLLFLARDGSGADASSDHHVVHRPRICLGEGVVFARVEIRTPPEGWRER